MIVKRERIYTKKESIYTYTYKRTSWWLFGVIPVFINNKILGRS